jgi:hypothetical protein
MACIPSSLEVQKDTFRISDSRVQDSSSILARNRIADWRYNFGDNYIEQAASNDGVIRWDT